MQQNPRFYLGQYEFVFVSVLSEETSLLSEYLKKLYSEFYDVEKINVIFSRDVAKSIIARVLNSFERFEPDGIAKIYVFDKDVSSPFHILIEVETTGSRYVVYQSSIYNALGLKLSHTINKMPLRKLDITPFSIVIAIRLPEHIIDNLLDRGIPIFQIFPIRKHKFSFEISSSKNDMISKFKKIVINHDLSALRNIIENKDMNPIHKIFILRFAYIYGDEKMKAELDNIVSPLDEAQLEQQAVSELDRKYVNYLTDEQVRALDRSHIAALSPEQISNLTPAQIAALTPAQIALLTPEQIAALSSIQIGALKPEQIIALTPAQIAALTPSQIAALTPAQIAEIPPEKFKSLPDKVKIRLISVMLEGDFSIEYLQQLVEILLSKKEIAKLLKERLED